MAMQGGAGQVETDFPSGEIAGERHGPLRFLTGSTIRYTLEGRQPARNKEGPGVKPVRTGVRGRCVMAHICT